MASSAVEKLAKLTGQRPSLDRFRGVCSVLRDMILASVAENDLAFIYSDTWRQGWKILKVPPKQQNPAQGIQSFYYDHDEQDRLVDALSEVFEAMRLGAETIGIPADIENIFLAPVWIRMLGSRTGKERIWKIIFTGTEDKAIFTEIFLSHLSGIFDNSLPHTTAEMHEKLPQSMWWIKVSDIFNYEFRYAINRVLLCASYHRVSMVDPVQTMHKFDRIAMIARMIGDRDQLRHELELLNADRKEAEAILVNRDRLCAEEVTRAEVKKEEIKGKWRKITLLLKEAEIDFDFIFESEREGQHVIDVGVRSLLDANREYIGELPRYRPLFAPKISEDSGGEIAAIETKGVETEKECTLNAADIKISVGSIFEMVRAAAKDGAEDGANKAIKETQPKKRKAITWAEATMIYYRIIDAKRTDGTNALTEEEKRRKIDSFRHTCCNWIKAGMSPKTGTPISWDDLASTQAFTAWVQADCQRMNRKKGTKRYFEGR